jgi:3D (Asp-Asp-Asp) domain-containing protein
MKNLNKNNLRSIETLILIISIPILMLLSFIMGLSCKEIINLDSSVREISISQGDNPAGVEDHGGFVRKARITKYGATGNRMANNEYPHIGAVAVSDYSIPLGTKILIDGQEYTIKDRTAKWIHNRFGLTIDIYSEETEQEMLEWGSQIKEIEFIEL